MIDDVFALQYEVAQLQSLLRTGGIAFTGAESLAQLKAMAATAGLGSSAQSPLKFFTADGIGSVTEYAPNGVAGYIAGLSNVNGLVAATRCSVPMAAGQRAKVEAVVTLGIGNAVFQGTIAGNVLTVISMTSGYIVAGQTISGSGVTSATISAFGTGGTTGTGGAGTYQISISQTVASSTTITAAMASGVIDVAATLCVSTDGGTTWARLSANGSQLTGSRIFGQKIAWNQNASITLLGAHTVTSAVSAIFGVRFGNADNTQTISCLGERQNIQVTVA